MYYPVEYSYGFRLAFFNWFGIPILSGELEVPFDQQQIYIKSAIMRLSFNEQMSTHQSMVFFFFRRCHFQSCLPNTNFTVVYTYLIHSNGSGSQLIDIFRKRWHFIDIYSSNCSLPLTLCIIFVCHLFPLSSNAFLMLQQLYSIIAFLLWSVCLPSNRNLNWFK